MGTILLIICLLFLQRFGENVGQVMDPNHASMLKSAATPGQPSGLCDLPWTDFHFRHILHGSVGGLSGPLQQVQARNQQLPVSAQVFFIEIMLLTLSRFSHCIFFGPYALTANVLLAGPTQAGNNLTLKGWPLTVSSAL
ncbi:hypothetical protein B296_00046236 [Ensete ventricosum]|uniref:CRIB domain-containing protein n=1 Tax=Ensete ventricosum TaxID=4639 RepID=A0A426Z4L8_ENSVE|nr:hypothetical protein B296_00046236 [Ensete ventricosum]